MAANTGETLVIHPGALGDVLLAVPALRALRGAFPGEALVLAAQPRIGRLLTALGVSDRDVAFDSLHLDALFVDESAADHRGDPTLAAPTPLSPKIGGAARVVCWFGARDPTFVRRLSELAPGALVCPPTPSDDTLVWEHLARSVSAIAPGPPERGPIAVPQSLEAAGRRGLLDAAWDGTTRLVLIHPGAGGAGKRWPVEGFARVLEELTRSRDLAVVIHQGPADGEAVEALLARHRAGAIRLIEPSLPVLAGVLGRVAGYLGNDSGISHLAAAVGASAVVLFRKEMLAWRPWSAAARPLVVATETLDLADVAAVTAGARVLLG